jgi:hypothetical protein
MGSFMFRSLKVLAYIMTAVFVIYVGMKIGSDAIKDSRVAAVISKGASSVPFTSGSGYRIYYVGEADALCTDCGGAKDYWLPGASMMSVWATGGEHYLHCVSYADNSMPWAEQVKFFGSDYVKLTVDQDLSDEELVRSLLKQMEGLDSALKGCKLRGDAWENEGTDQKRRLLRAVRADANIKGVTENIIRIFK